VQKKNQVRYLSRDIFLDNQKSGEYTRRQLFKAVRLAKKRGQAIAIGHPYPTTYLTLSKYLPEMAENGVEITRITDI